MIEPLYSLDVAAELIPLTKSALQHILNRKPELFKEALYHNMTGEHTGAVSKVRMLRESEVLLVRDIVLHRWTRAPHLKSRGVKRPSRFSRFLTGEDYVGHTVST